MRQAIKDWAKVLVVDDHPLVRKGLKTLFETSGYTSVIVAQDGIDALEKMHEGHVDLVVTDTNMPRMSGLELTKQIRSDKTLPQQPVIIGISINHSPILASEYIQAGANKFVSKGEPDLPNVAENLLNLRFENN